LGLRLLFLPSGDQVLHSLQASRYLPSVIFMHTIWTWYFDFFSELCVLLPFWGPFVKLPKAIICFVMSVSLADVRMEQLGSLWKDFLEIRWVFFRESGEKIQVSLKSDNRNGYFTWRPIYLFIISRSVLLRMRYVSDKVVEKIKTHTLFSITFFFRKSCHVCDNVEKYYRTGHRC
jgi:hypothetical protein